jgi:hypothetical protein
MAAQHGASLARKRGVYTGRKSGISKAAPFRARALRKQGLKVSEIASALGVKQRSVYNYLSRSAQFGDKLAPRPPAACSGIDSKEAAGRSLHRQQSGVISAGLAVSSNSRNGVPSEPRFWPDRLKSAAGGWARNLLLR